MCHLSTRLHSLNEHFEAKRVETQAVLSPGHSGNQGRDQVAEAGPRVGDMGRSPGFPIQTGRGCSQVINFNHCLEIGPPGGKSEAATCN